MLNLDTHIVVALLNGELTKAEENAIVGDSLAISDIVLWELAKLVELGRLDLNLDDVEFRSFLRNSTIFPITPEIAIQSTELDFKSDPADEIIAATSVVEKIPLITRDRRIRKTKMVKFAG